MAHDLSIGLRLLELRGVVSPQPVVDVLDGYCSVLTRHAFKIIISQVLVLIKVGSVHEMPGSLEPELPTLHHICKRSAFNKWKLALLPKSRYPYVRGRQYT